MEEKQVNARGRVNSGSESWIFSRNWIEKGKPRNSPPFPLVWCKLFFVRDLIWILLYSLCARLTSSHYPRGIICTTIFWAQLIHQLNYANMSKHYERQLVHWDGQWHMMVECQHHDILLSHNSISNISLFIGWIWSFWWFTWCFWFTKKMWSNFVCWKSLS